MRKLVVSLAMAMFLALTIIGQSWAGKAPKPPKPVKNDSIIKSVVSAKMLPDFRWHYVLKLKKSAKSKSLPFLPFAMGEFDEWQVQDLDAPKSKKYYLLEIITFNREIALTYGGWYDQALPPEKWNWAAIQKSKFYDKDRKVLVIGFYNGQLYKKGTAPFAPAPGKFGDNVIRFDISGDQLTAYFNNNTVNGSVAHPVYMANVQKWAVNPQLIQDSDGWGSTIFQVQFPLTLKVNFSGDDESGSWADISSSNYYYRDEDGSQYLQACFDPDQSRKVAALADVAEVSITACKVILNFEPVKLLSRQRLPDLRWQYQLGLDKYSIIGPRLLPSVITDVINNFAVTALKDEDGDGFYEVVIETFNREISLNYGDNLGDPDLSKRRFADVRHSVFWSQVSQTLIIGLHEGALFTKGRAPFAAPPGAQGDDFLRFNFDGHKLAVYFNNGRVNGSVAKPFKMWNLDRWVPANQLIEDSNGWGKAEVEVGLPLTLDLTYGGDQAGNSWVTGMQNSMFFFKDPITGDEFFRVCIQ